MLLRFDPDSNTYKAKKRLLLYVVTLSAIAIFSLVVVYAVKGYDIDRETGEVVKNGLILARSEPVEAKIYTDGSDEVGTTPANLALPEGSHHLTMEADGYRKWQKKIKLTGLEVYSLEYPLIIPSKPKNISSTKLDSHHNSLASPDNKMLAVSASNNSPSIQIYTKRCVL